MSSRVWKLKPELTLEINDGYEDIQHRTVATDIFLIENAVSRIEFTAENNDGRMFLQKLRKFDNVRASLNYSGYDPYICFLGKIEKLGPVLSPQFGVTLKAVAYGLGRSLRNTHCAVDYGVESDNSTTDTPSEIISDIATNRVNKNFDAGNTGYSLDGSTKVLSMTNPSIQFLMGGYRKNIDLLNEICLLYQAYRAGSAGVHWRVDPSDNLWVDTIAAHSVDTDNWPTYWNWGQNESLLAQKRDIIDAVFSRDLLNYANKIVLATDLRKPGFDYWTEDSGGSKLWSDYLLTSIADSAAEYVVGSHSLLFTSNGATIGYALFPSSVLAADAAAAQKDVTVTDATAFKVGDSVRLWDNTPDNETATIASIVGAVLTMENNLANNYTQAAGAICTKRLQWNMDKIGSSKNPPQLKFYYYINTHIAVATTWIILYTSAYPGSTDYYYAQFCTNADKGEWQHFSIPIGNYWKTDEFLRDYEWTPAGGAPDWTNINSIAFLVTGSAGNNGLLYVDDLHITGKLLREAYDSSEITSYDEIQKIIKMETAVDDTLLASDDSGTAGRLAYAELLHATAAPLKGTVRCPLMPKALPGQLAHIHFDKTLQNNFRVDDDFRFTQVHHHFGQEVFTELTVTDDVVNTFAAGPNEALSVLAKALFYDPEAKSLKTTGIDTLVARLSKAY